MKARINNWQPENNTSNAALIKLPPDNIWNAQLHRQCAPYRRRRRSGGSWEEKERAGPHWPITFREAFFPLNILSANRKVPASSSVSVQWEVQKKNSFSQQTHTLVWCRCSLVLSALFRCSHITPPCFTHFHFPFLYPPSYLYSHKAPAPPFSLVNYFPPSFPVSFICCVPFSILSCFFLSVLSSSLAPFLLLYLPPPLLLDQPPPPP